MNRDSDVFSKRVAFAHEVRMKCDEGQRERLAELNALAQFCAERGDHGAAADYQYQADKLAAELNRPAVVA